VEEFPDVFPDDLPGMLPDRDIEFVIELLPRIAPIVKRPYGMGVNCNTPGVKLAFCTFIT
jgi:hypothetical protein